MGRSSASKRLQIDDSVRVEHAASRPLEASTVYTKEITERDGKWGLLITGAEDTGERVRVAGDIWTDSPDYQEPVYRPSERWALAPEFDVLEDVTADHGWTLKLYRVTRNAKLGLYWLGYRASGEFAITEKPEWEENNFSATYVRAGHPLDGGFLLRPQHSILEVETYAKKFAYHIIVDNRHGILSWHGFWLKRPAYEDMLAVAPDIMLGRQSGRFELLDFGTKSHGRPISTVLLSANWKKIASAMSQMTDLSVPVDEVEQRWQVGAHRKKFFSFGAR